jgi:hypothetical protein
METVPKEFLPKKTVKRPLSLLTLPTFFLILEFGAVGVPLARSLIVGHYTPFSWSSFYK